MERAKAKQAQEEREEPEINRDRDKEKEKEKEKARGGWGGISAVQRQYHDSIPWLMRRSKDVTCFAAASDASACQDSPPFGHYHLHSTLESWVGHGAVFRLHLCDGSTDDAISGRKAQQMLRPQRVFANILRRY